MGKRVNLAELATDDIDAYTPTAAAARATEQQSPAQTTRSVPVSTVTTNPLNARPASGDDELTDMAETIRERGLIQPLVVVTANDYLAEFPGQHESIDGADWVALIGNRRLLAARIAGLDDIPIIPSDDHVGGMWELMLVENVQRRALPPLREAEAMQQMLQREDISQRELARRLGKSHTYIAQRLTLLNLIPELRDALESDELTVETARQLGELPQQQQATIAAAGPPYRLRSTGNAVASRRSIRVSSPSSAAESIRAAFSDQELAELIRLLTTDAPEPGTSP
jgi:ParB family chromosome partitioning protein